MFAGAFFAAVVVGAGCLDDVARGVAAVLVAPVLFFAAVPFVAAAVFFAAAVFVDAAVVAAFFAGTTFADAAFEDTAFAAPAFCLPAGVPVAGASGVPGAFPDDDLPPTALRAVAAAAAPTCLAADSAPLTMVCPTSGCAAGPVGPTGAPKDTASTSLSQRRNAERQGLIGRT